MLDALDKKTILQINYTWQVNSCLTATEIVLGHNEEKLVYGIHVYLEIPDISNQGLGHHLVVSDTYKIH